MIITLVYGFLGAGKTTFIRRLLANPPEDEKLVVLVNEFGEIGLDGIVLENQDNLTADVVEVSAGCICCTMATDFRRQIFDLTQRFSPDRLVIEPTGVATISQITAILDRKDLRSLYHTVQLTLILDAADFLSFMKSNRHFMENQIRAADVMILNKTDRIPATSTPLFTASLNEINPGARVIPTDFCRLDRQTLSDILKYDPGEPAARREQEDVLPNGAANGMAYRYQTVGKQYRDKVFSRHRLESFFESLGSQKWGETVRAKGNFKTDCGWSRIEFASGDVSIGTGSADPAGISLVSIIGRFMNTPAMMDGLNDCFLEK